jgi:hypothetical protein
VTALLGSGGRLWEVRVAATGFGTHPPQDTPVDAGAFCLKVG